MEIDAVVGTKCLEAGLQLKGEVERQCFVQICTFAQVPIFSESEGDEGGEVVRGLLAREAGGEGVDVIGSTPYVEADREKMQRNVEWMVDLAISKHVKLWICSSRFTVRKPEIWRFDCWRPAAFILAAELRQRFYRN